MTFVELRSARRSSEELEHRALQRRAVEAAIWGMPIVSVDAMRQAFFREAHARYNDIVYLSRPADWRFQITTPSASTRYVFFPFNTRSGPLVLDIPAARGAALFGSVNDAWQVPMADIGPAGEDEGRGGRYLLIPPLYKERDLEGFLPVRFQTFNGYGALRAIPNSASDADAERAIALIKKIRLYPLARVGQPVEQRFIDMAGRFFDGIVRYDETFYDGLARIVDEEPVNPRDYLAMAYLRALGIEKGKSFNPGPATREILHVSISEAHETLMHAVTTGRRVWPDTRWIVPGTGVGQKTGFSFVVDDRLDVDERGMTFFHACARSKKSGKASLSIWGVRDSHDELLDGGAGYRLRIPARPPARQFWSVTAYDLECASFFHESEHIEVSSNHSTLRGNSDGSIDVYFGPRAPAGLEANWIFTAPDRTWFSVFRFHGPEDALFDGRWSLPDLEPL